MATNLFKSLLFIGVFGALSAACKESDVPASKAEAAAQTASQAPAAPLVNDNASKILFSWFEGNEAKTAMKIADIPDGVKKEVRVQDLSIPPDKRDPEWIFLANLTKKNGKGGYPVRTVHRDKYEQKRHPKQKAGISSAESAVADNQANVTMYATPHCPHCKKARRWLLEQKIPYDEINLEKDQAAAATLAQKGQAQGVPTGGVPMFEINGRLIPGFDPAAIRKALSQPPLKTAPPTKMPPVVNPAPPSATPQKPATPPSAITI